MTVGEGRSEDLRKGESRADRAGQGEEGRGKIGRSEDNKLKIRLRVRSLRRDKNLLNRKEYGSDLAGERPSIKGGT